MADAYLLRAAPPGERERQDVLSHHGPAGVVEIATVLLKSYALSKVSIALGIEPEAMPVTVV